MRPNFEYYLASVERWPFHVGVDMSFHAKSPIDGLRFRAHVRLELNHPNQDGLATAEENALLLAVEERILESLPPEKARLVAHVTHQKARTLVIYLDERPNEGHVIFDILSAIKTHKTRVIVEDDPEWNEYREYLFPNEFFRHQIKDRHVLREFERRGDDCSQVHSIEPVFAGLTRDGAKTLAGELKSAGFDVKHVVEGGMNGKADWQVIGKVESPLALAILDDFRQPWIDLAAKTGGQYEGWAAELIPCH